jgi:hypothetical protein
VGRRGGRAAHPVAVPSAASRGTVARSAA